MSAFQPPPTYENPVVVNPLTGIAEFSPVWLKWFIDLAANLGASGAGNVTGPATSTTGGLAVYADTTGEVLSDVGTALTSQILVGGGLGANPVWTTATGSGAPVRATSPTLTSPIFITPALGTPNSGSLVNCTNVPIGALTGTMAQFDAACSNGDFVFQSQALGTPSSGVATNFTGTAAGLTAGNVTTNANLTGMVTSVGNVASLGSFTMAQLDTAVSDGNVVYQSQALGTPLSGNLTNCTGYPGTSTLVTTGVLNSGSISSGFGAIDIGTDTLIAGASTLQTLTVGLGAGSVATNTAVGVSALTANGTGATSTAVGYEALKAHTVGTGNTAVGYQALLAITTGFNNTAVGYQALKTGTGGATNTAVGYTAASLTTGTNNTVVGYTALNGSGTGSENTALGASALGTNTSGQSNAAVGVSALGVNTSGSDCVAVGRQALGANKSGTDNVALGRSALLANTSGSFNTAVGRSALAGSISALNNTAVGYQALFTTSTGASNVALGFSAGKYETTSNTFYVDNQDRTNTAGDKAKALLYGIFAAAAVDQFLTVNGYLLTLSLGASLVTNANATYTVLKSDFTIIQTTAASVYTLLAAATYPGKLLLVLNRFAGTVTSASSNVVPAAGGSAGTAILAANAGAFALMQSDGTNWQIIMTTPAGSGTGYTGTVQTAVPTGNSITISAGAITGVT